MSMSCCVVSAEQVLSSLTCGLDHTGGGLLHIEEVQTLSLFSRLRAGELVAATEDELSTRCFGAPVMSTKSDYKLNGLDRTPHLFYYACIGL